MRSPRYDVIFLDFYGTVASGDRHAIESLCRQIVDELELPFTPPELARCWGDHFFTLLNDANQDNFRDLHTLECESLVTTLHDTVGPIDPQPFVRRLKDYWSDPPIYEDAVTFISDCPLPICCVSNADTEDITAAIAKNNLNFASLITSEETRCYKPNGRIFQSALEIMNTHPDRVLHVGDSLLSDVGGAIAAGIHAAWICREDRIYDIGKLHCDSKISLLGELLPMLAT
jgi:2-haloacid dehalogenase/putative hydrolase of the HAD superfamily